MTEPTVVSRTFTGCDDLKTVAFETGKLAGLAGGSVLASQGDTRILVTATGAGKPREGADFFPLTVDIEERMYAAGKIPGSFFRREARAGEAAILTCRLIDRPLRPSFPDGYRNEVHVVGTVMGADQKNPYDVLAINAASAALCISPIPFSGPIGAVRIAWSADGTWIPHPTYEEGAASSFEMVVAGRLLDDGDVAVMMVEAGGTESSWENYQGGATKVDEEVLTGGLEASKQWIREAIELQQELIDAVDVPEKMEVATVVDYSDEVFAAVESAGTEALTENQKISDKAQRAEADADASAKILEAVLPQFADLDGAERQVKAAIRSLTKRIVRRRIVEEGIRIDGRGVSDLRPLSAEVGVIPTAHGSGLFQRGETQVLNFTTLGTKRMDQMVDGIDPQERKRYMHHYNFPPFSTGETGFMRGPKRREIGHGVLAERAVFPLVPTMEEFPYTLRLVSEVLSSNGSTSMASVCGSSLSLMDAGVPIKAPVAGIAMGLVYAEGTYTTLTDILGAEDAFGDMDFKVAGTDDFVTALQLDTKIDGIPASVLSSALEQAREARLQILDVMAEAIPAPRDDVSETAPKILSFEIPVDKIGEVIGPKGKVINTIQAETGAEVGVDDDGMVGVVTIASSSRAEVDEAERQIRLILNPPTAEVGATYTGRVVNVTKFGAFVNILPGRDGLVHISKLGGGKRIDKVEDVVDLGDEIEVRVEDVDPMGKISLIPVDDGDDRAPASSDAREREEPAEEPAEKPAEARSGGGDDGGSRGRQPRSEPREKASSDDEGDGGGERKGDTKVASFEDVFEDELREEFGDLGPTGGGRRRRR